MVSIIVIASVVHFHTVSTNNFYADSKYARPNNFQERFRSLPSKTENYPKNFSHLSHSQTYLPTNEKIAPPTQYYHRPYEFVNGKNQRQSRINRDFHTDTNNRDLSSRTEIPQNIHSHMFGVQRNLSPTSSSFHQRQSLDSGRWTLHSVDKQAGMLNGEPKVVPPIYVSSDSFYHRNFRNQFLNVWPVQHNGQLAGGREMLSKVTKDDGLEFRANLQPVRTYRNEPTIQTLQNPVVAKYSAHSLNRQSNIGSPGLKSGGQHLHHHNRRHLRNRNLHLVLRLMIIKPHSAINNDCIVCPKDKIVVANRNKKCSAFVLPPVTSCESHDDGRSGRPLHVYLHGRNRGQKHILPEGLHTITLHIKTAKHIHVCSFKYHVKVNRCDHLPAISNGKIECNHGRVWGSSCSFFCAPGYFLQGFKSTACSGDDNHVAWSHPKPHCIAIDSCLAPTLPFHSGIRCSHSKSENHYYPSGTACQFSCDDGYAMSYETPSTLDDTSPVDVLVCVKGKWNFTAVPNCSAVPCKMPSNPPNGFIRCDEADLELYDRGTVCQFICIEGFVIPIHQREHATFKCLGPEWSSESSIGCQEAIAPSPKGSMCSNQTVTATQLTAFVPRTEFLTASGEDALVACSLDDVTSLSPGVYINTCTASDPHLGTTADCQYSIEIKFAGCMNPPAVAEAELNCSSPSFNSQYLIGTICQYICIDGFTIPTSYLDIAEIQCQPNLTWNSIKLPICTRIFLPDLVQGTCDNISMYTNNPSEIQFLKPEFFTHSGSIAKVLCNLSSIDDFGEFVNMCTATDPELRTIATCHYQISVQESKCSRLFPPANGEVTCQTNKLHHDCHLHCLKGYRFSFQYEELRKKNISCNLETAVWNFQDNYKTDILPDCLGVSTTSMYTHLHFNLTVYSCENNEAMDNIQEYIKRGLISHNQIICDQIFCANFTFMCSQLFSNTFSLETTWNVMATYATDLDDYSYDEKEDDAESMLTKIQVESHSLITSNSNFHDELLSLGATIIPNSYWQGIIDLICPEEGHILEDETFQCLQCPTGTFYEHQTCSLCPPNTFQDETGQLICKQCPPDSNSVTQGARMKSQCYKEIDNVAALQDSVPFDYCFPNPCQNGGTCMRLQDDALCICDEYHEGIFCEKAILQCPHNFCLNGGKCLQHAEMFSCKCPITYKGIRCEISNKHYSTNDNLPSASHHLQIRNNNPCEQRPCRNGGTCQTNHSSLFYHCNCRENYTGPNCEYLNCPKAYSEYFCLNGARCITIEETHAMVCLCQKGFMGTRCEFFDSKFVIGNWFFRIYTASVTLIQQTFQYFFVE